ncbi:MAG: tRNA threonylcarbamoyladenosine biosynthesis protein [Planctomycetota bacterium]|nr:MAG: tRNA threonylcarbamoyladenosine biosynthesis protein [Planctomycetota bacterium]
MSCPVGVDVAHAARLLREGKLVSFATETVYGLGANALDVNAVARVFAVKNRPHFDPLIVHIAERSWLPRLVTAWSETAERIANRFWPGPLTLVLPKTELVPDLVTSGLPSVAVRMPSHPMALELLRLADVPVAAPSANLFGQLSPTRAEHVADRLGDQIDYLLDGGPCSVGVESTVLLLEIALEDIESLIGPVTLPSSTTTSDQKAAPSPGMLPQHYAPRTPLAIVDDLDSLAEPNRCGLLTLQPQPAASRFAAVEVLSVTGNLTEAAANFFAALRRLDAARVEQIVALPFPNHGLGRALNDRLTRAAH